MDTFFEQIVKIKPTQKSRLLLSLLWVASFVLVFTVIYLSLIFPSIMMFIVIGIFGIMAGTYKLSQRFLVEYEYIVTNGELDIDKIVGKSSRKRLITLSCSEVEATGKYKPEEHKNRNYSNQHICCNTDDDAVYFVARHQKQGLVLVVIAPDERILSTLKKSIPRHISSSL